jgi:hypothetical protein
MAPEPSDKRYTDLKREHARLSSQISAIREAQESFNKAVDNVGGEQLNAVDWLKDNPPDNAEQFMAIATRAFTVKGAEHTSAPMGTTARIMEGFRNPVPPGVDNNVRSERLGFTDEAGRLFGARPHPPPPEWIE